MHVAFLQSIIIDMHESRLQIWGPTQIISDVFQNWVCFWSAAAASSLSSSGDDYYLVPATQCLQGIPWQLRRRCHHLWTTDTLPAFQKVYWCELINTQSRYFVYPTNRKAHTHCLYLVGTQEPDSERCNAVILVTNSSRFYQSICTPY